jgi:uncharacterized phiE125 gp8 family phage protein
MLTELTAPALDAEAAMELAGRLRLPDDPTQDPGLARALDQALALALRHVELAAGRALPQRGFRLAAPGWSEGLVLTVAPVAALDRIALVDAEGAETLCELTDFRVDDFRAWPTVVPRTGVSAPLVPEGGRVVVDFQAGYGPGWSAIPAELRVALIGQAAHLFRRDAGENAGAPGLCPDAAIALEPFRRIRL